MSYSTSTSSRRLIDCLFGNSPGTPQDELMGEIDRATDYDVVSEVGELGRSFIQGGQRLSAVEVCLHLEKCTPLLLFHLLPRKGTRNQLRSGLQQSYGDHIRVLSRAIEVLAACDAKWL